MRNLIQITSLRQVLIAGMLCLATLGCDESQAVSENVLEVWTYTGGGGKKSTGLCWTTIARRFEAANPGVRVRVTADIPHTQYMSVLGTRFIGGNAPDVMLLDDIDVSELGREHLLLPLDDRIAATFGNKPRRFVPSMVKDAKVLGKTYAIPWSGSWMHLIYRSDVFESLQLKPPSTWQELREVCQTLQREKQIPHPLAFDPRGAFWLISFIWQNGGQPLTDDFRKVTLSTPEAIGGVQFVHDLVFKDRALDPTLASGTNPQDLWATGQAVMMIDGGWMTGRYDETYPALAGKWEIAPLPAGRVPVSFFGGCDLAIGRDSKNPDLAWKFIVFATSTENQLLYTELTGSVSANLDAFDSPGFITKYPHMARMRPALGNGRNTPLIGFFSLLWYDVFKSSVLDRVMTNANADIAAVVREAEPSMQRLVDDYWARHPDAPVMAGPK